MATDNPFAILDDTAQGRDTWRLPTFGPGTEELRPEHGETVLHVIRDCNLEISNQAGSGGTWQTIWRSPAPGTLTATDRRVAYGCRRFEAGSSYGGFGVAGLAAGLALTAISKGLAKARSAGHCFGAQARHPSVAAVAFTRLGSASPPVGVVHFDALGDDRRWRFSFCAVHPAGTTPAIAEAVAAAAIAAREPWLGDLSASETGELKAIGSPVLRPGPGATAVIAVPGARRPPVANRRAVR